MPSKAPGRNDPCPCGSGRKYKKCCLGHEGATGPAVKVNEELRAEGDGLDWWSGLPADLLQLEDWMHEGEHAVQDGHFERAEELCEKIFKGFPDVIHGHYLLGKLRAAQGRWADAAAAFGEAVRMIEANRREYRDAVLKEMRGYLDEARARQIG